MTKTKKKKPGEWIMVSVFSKDKYKIVDTETGYEIYALIDVDLT